MPENKNTEQLSDEELVGLASSNPEFFVHIVERYEQKILRYIRRISSATQETAEDLAQESFIKAYLNINQFDRKLKFSSWLYRIAHNHVISYWRKHKNETPTIYWSQSDPFDKIVESNVDLIRHLDSQLLKKRMALMLNTLKPVHKELLILRYIEDRDYQEISDIIKRPIGSVGTMILRAKAELQSKMSTMKDH